MTGRDAKRLPPVRREILYGRGLVRCFADRPADVDAMFRASVAAHGERVALVDGTRRMSYAELDRAASALAAGLAGLGLAPGERIALVMGNEIEFVVAFLAAMRAGLVSVPLNTRHRRAELDFILSQCSASAIIVDAEHLEAVPERRDLPHLRHVIVRGDGDVPGGCVPLAGLLRAEPREPGHGIAQEDVLCLLYTSGTTGQPKGAMLTHVGVIHSVLHYGLSFGLGPDDVAFLSVPATHVTGLVAIVLAGLQAGARIVILASFRARDFLECAARERITYSLMVPAMYNLCLLDPELERHDLSSWRVAAFGGAPMPDATVTSLAARLPGLSLCNVYGATETTSPATLTPIGAISRHPGSIGRALPLADIAIVDDQGREVADGEIGELLIGGPMVVPGYWGNPAATADGFVGGYWRSGDIGRRDADGYLHILDRRKDLINRGGFKIYCVEVEDVLAQHPAVIESAVVGYPDDVLGERVRAFVHTGGRPVSEADLVAFCRARLSDYKVPEIVTIVDEALPRNPNGKLLKTALRTGSTG